MMEAEEGENPLAALCSVTEEGVPATPLPGDHSGPGPGAGPPVVRVLWT